MSEEKLSMAENSTQMNELDKQLAQWQSAYKDATPSVDTDSLIKETKSARFKLKLKAALHSNFFRPARIDDHVK